MAGLSLWESLAPNPMAVNRSGSFAASMPSGPVQQGSPLAPENMLQYLSLSGYVSPKWAHHLATGAKSDNVIFAEHMYPNQGLSPDARQEERDRMNSLVPFGPQDEDPDLLRQYEQFGLINVLKKYGIAAPAISGAALAMSRRNPPPMPAQLSQ